MIIQLYWFIINISICFISVYYTYESETRNRLVKSPGVYVRDSGLVSSMLYWVLATTINFPATLYMAQAGRGL
jgi:hypothetical protein